MDSLPPINRGNISSMFGKIFKEPVVVVQRKDGRVVEIPKSELEKHGIDPNQNDDGNLWEKIINLVNDLKDWLSQGF